MDRRNFIVGTAGISGFAGSMALGSGSVMAAKPAGRTGGELAAPVTGLITNPATGVVSEFAGTLTVERFANVAGQLVAVGKVVGNVLTLAGQVVQSLTQAVQMPVTINQATCDVLSLVLGPLHLEVLGLEIDLNQVVLTITANPAGGLLGQLLCALVGVSLIDQLVNLLNQLLGLFGQV